jgi:hypothetical protein
MKKLLLVLVFVIGMAGIANAILYTFFVNIVSDDSNAPLIGLVNISKGNHRTFHLGLVSVNSGDFSGFQVGLANIVGGDYSGFQMSLANIVGGNFSGFQMGLANFVGSDFRGFQFGLLNSAPGKLSGFQFGLVNYRGDAENGLQLGLVNIARVGGYMALEYSFSEFYPVTIAFKSGVEKFYTSLFFAYVPEGGSAKRKIASGIGFGSILPISGSLFFNPEINYLGTV